MKIVKHYIEKIHREEPAFISNPGDYVAVDVTLRSKLHEERIHRGVHVLDVDIWEEAKERGFFSSPCAKKRRIR